MLEVEGYTLPEDVYISLKGLTWARIEGDLVRVGLLDYAQALAGRILFVNLKKPGTKVLFEKPLGTLESGKWAGPILSPVSGEIVEINTEVRRKPSLVNDDPYGRGWLAILRPTALDLELPKLLKGEAAVEALRRKIAEDRKKYRI